MADREGRAPAAAAAQQQAVQSMVMLTPAQHAARELQREMDEMKAQGIQLDRTVPHGRYQGADGSWHDAHGRTLDDDGVATSDVDTSGVPVPPAVRAARTGVPADLSKFNAEEHDAFVADQQEQREASVKGGNVNADRPASLVAAESTGGPASAPAESSARSGEPAGSGAARKGGASRSGGSRKR